MRLECVFFFVEGRVSNGKGDTDLQLPLLLISRRRIVVMKLQFHLQLLKSHWREAAHEQWSN